MMTTKWVCRLMVVAGTALFLVTAYQAVTGAMDWAMALVLLPVQAAFTALNIWLLRRSRRMAENEARWERSWERALERLDHDQR